MYETGHTGAGERDELRRALRLLEAALARHAQAGEAAVSGAAVVPPEAALVRALQMMRDEAVELRRRIAALG